MEHQRLAVKLSERYPNARFCRVFIDQLVFIEQDFGRGTVECITSEIDWLEGLTRSTVTKQPTEFSGKILGGLMHKHFFTANNVKKNIANRLLGENGSFKTIARRSFAQHQTDVATPEVVSTILSKIKAQVLVDQRAKESSLTGDWIVYERQSGRNTYLCLAEHEESNEEILHRFSAQAEIDFPDMKFWQPIRNAGA
jgi:hypothetical protein